jgi:hypothetical protein
MRPLGVNRKLSKPAWIQACRLRQPQSVYMCAAQVQVSGFMPYLYLSTWAAKTLSLPPEPGTRQS